MIRCLNKCRIYVDIMTGKKLSSIELANLEQIFWSVRSSSLRGGDVVKGVDGGNRYVSPQQVSFYQKHENLVLDLSNPII